jgi:8-oxo-dGTP diphosphatase
MPLYVVRHAHAGSRSAWIEDDRIRPLSDKGWLQAKAIAERIAPLGPSVLLTSPYLRCQQTLEPLGELCGLAVQHDVRLEEESPLELSLAAIEDAPDNAVLCSHGDVIPDFINGLIRRGMVINNSSPDPRKASTFVLHHVNGLFTHAEYWEPPAV